MQNNFIEKINVSVRIVLLFILVISIFMAKSIFLILFITILTLIILILSNQSVKLCIETLKNNLVRLLFFSLMYIIIFRNIYSSMIFVYKFILIILILKCFVVHINFNKLSNGIYSFLTFFCKKKIQIEKISYTISIYIFLIIYFLDSKSKIKVLQFNSGKIRYSIKNNWLPRLFMVMKDINILENNLKLKYFKITKEKNNFSSYVTLFLFIIFFIFVVFKEVVL